MTIRITYKKQDDIKNTMHYFYVDHVYIDRNEYGILCLSLATALGRVLKRIAFDDTIEFALMENSYI